MVTPALSVSYNGAPFHGFARQPGLLTVQGELEDALALLYKRPVETTCAGRTDAGVHALGQTVSFDLTEEELEARAQRSLIRSLNALTHDDIAIRAMRVEDEGFSARFDCTGREYRYFLACNEAPPLVMNKFSWHVPHELDVDAMNEGASYLIGEHDFKSFCLAVSAVGKPTCRNLRSVDVAKTNVLGDDVLCITVRGDSFLHSMVRTIVGTLVAVGRGRRRPEWVAEVLAACDRTAAGETAPAQGLVFWESTY